ncbi:MAG: HlyC/CorC family transporter [Clostridiales bacterium]|nr:HlyC/CorC family transporter [Clostridiales bacterium]
MDSDNPLWGIAIILMLILVMAIISGMKTALEHVSDSSVRKKAELGDKKANVLLGLMGSGTRYQITMDLLLCVFAIITGIIFTIFLLPEIESNIFSVLSMILLIFLVILFSVVLPKKMAIKYAEKITCFIFRIQPHEFHENIIEEEIVSMVNEGHEQGVFDAGKAEMITNIIGLDDKEAKDIMTHKKRIKAIDVDMSLEETLQFMLDENYSRYPLYADNLDNIIGILHLKDVLGAYISTDDKKKTLQEIAREPYFVPDTQSVNLLFHKMQSNNIHMAIVIDEYGQTSGLVAMEDFLEEIVGNIQDEYDKEEKLILYADKDSCVVKSSISLEDLEDELDIVIEHEDFDTLNGLLISILDRIPTDGEKATLQYGGYRFDILDTMNKMIGRVKITKLPKSLEHPLKGTVYEHG